MKIMITGASGMLGIELCRAGVKRFGKQNVVGLTHYDLDIMNDEMVASALKRNKPDVLINAAGLVKSRQLTEKAFEWVNGRGPHALALNCDSHGVRMVQISTDCVFSGAGPYLETDTPDAADIYGMSKMKGEIDWGTHMNLRMSFVGLGRRGLIGWLMQQKGMVQGYSRVQWNGLTAPYAAQRILDCLALENIRVYHIHGQDCTKYDVLVAANEALSLSLDVQPVPVPVADMRLRSIYPQPDMPPISVQIQEMVYGRRALTQPLR